MMSKLIVRVKNPYPIIFVDEIKRIEDEIPKLQNRVAIVTDSNVKKHYTGLFKRLSDKYEIFCFRAGEKHKTIDTCMKIIGQMQQKGFGRDSVIVAIGGGVTGDMAGFIAGIYMRGISVIQVPTTLLAMADSSVGGKTGVDTKFGKNLIGVFKQPAKVYIWSGFLETLSVSEFKNGLAETIKHAIISDSDFFHYLNENLVKIRKKDNVTIKEINRMNCMTKASIVEEDPEERGLRRVLNFGHTIGHAIELISRFKYSHGDCVAMGMVVEARISYSMGFLSNSDLISIIDIIKCFNLPTSVPRGIKINNIMNSVKLDKKGKLGAARYALPHKIGSMVKFNDEYSTIVDDNIVLNSIKESI